MKTIDIKSILAFLIFSIAILYQGCDDSGIMPEKPKADSTLINYDNLIINERTPPFDSAYSSVDLFKGEIVQELSTLKDAVLVDIIDTVSTDTNYYFRSGDLSIDGQGKQTRFKQYVYPDLIQSKFDTLSVIPDSDSTLNENDFEANETPFFIRSLQTHPVYGFYLKGKNVEGITTKPVYGMIYLDSAWRENGKLKLRFDVKINVNGVNKFKVPTR